MTFISLNGLIQGASFFKIFFGHFHTFISLLSRLYNNKILPHANIKNYEINTYQN